jgi:hypothetical protein
MNKNSLKKTLNLLNLSEFSSFSKAPPAAKNPKPSSPLLMCQ